MTQHTRPTPGSDSTLLLTKSELAKHLRCSERQIDKLTAAGRIPAPVIVGKSRRWSRAEIQDWIYQKTHSPS